MSYLDGYMMETEQDRLIKVRDSTGSIAILTGLVGLAKPSPTILGLAALFASISFIAELKIRQNY